MNDSDSSCVQDDQMPELCRECTARHQGICGALRPAELIELNKISSQRTFEAGLTLVGDEEEFPFFANVLEGVLKLSKVLPDGRQQIVGLQFAPDFMGRPFHSESTLTVETATSTKLCSMPRTKFEKMLADSSDLQQRLLKQILGDLDESRDWLVTLGRKNAGERVASFLFMISQHLPDMNENPDEAVKTGAPVFDLPLTRADMADFLGLTIETVSRQLSKLKKTGVISISHNRHIEIHDMEKLREAGEE
jgi:CRP/FNR family transcriptional regulator